MALPSQLAGAATGLVAVMGATVRTIATRAPALGVEVTHLPGTLRGLRLLVEELPGRLDHIEANLDRAVAQLGAHDLAAARPLARNGELDSLAETLSELQAAVAALGEQLPGAAE